MSSPRDDHFAAAFEEAMSMGSHRQSPGDLLRKVRSVIPVMPITYVLFLANVALITFNVSR